MHIHANFASDPEMNKRVKQLDKENLPIIICTVEREEEERTIHH